MTTKPLNKVTNSSEGLPAGTGIVAVTGGVGGLAVVGTDYSAPYNTGIEIFYQFTGFASFSKTSTGITCPTDSILTLYFSNNANVAANKTAADLENITNNVGLYQIFWGKNVGSDTLINSAGIGAGSGAGVNLYITASTGVITIERTGSGFGFACIFHFIFSKATTSAAAIILP